MFEFDDPAIYVCSSLHKNKMHSRLWSNFDDNRISLQNVKAILCKIEQDGMFDQSEFQSMIKICLIYAVH